MGLASTGRIEHPAARRGIAFLLDTVRGDASWPLEASHGVSCTALSINALAAASGDVGALGCLEWLLGCQRTDAGLLKDSAPGGWCPGEAGGFSPEVADTSIALLALSVLLKSGAEAHRSKIEESAAAGVRWLLAAQNDDGGWPIFGADRMAHRSIAAPPS